MNDMPDIGTLGGTMQDQYGDSSAVSGGRLSDYQSYANEDVNTNPWGYDFSSAGYSDPGTYSLGNFFGYDQSTGLPTSSGPNAGNVGAFSFNDLENSKFGKLAMGILGMTPAGKAFNVARGVTNMLGKGDVLGGASQIAGAYGGAPGAMINAGVQASRGNYAPGMGLAGGFAAGPVGGFMANQVGQAMTNAGPSSRGTGQGPQQSNGFDVEGLVGGLGQLYAATQANKGLSGLGGNNSAINQQIQSLGSMYSPNSPYAQQLRQTLERKDAAAGRRSQYGPREVQLMAALADKQAGVADTMGRLATSGQANQIALNNQKNQTRAQQLALLANLGKKSGLFDMFSGGGSSTPATPSYSSYPVYDTADYGGSM